MSEAGLLLACVCGSWVAALALPRLFPGLHAQRTAAHPPPLPSAPPSAEEAYSLPGLLPAAGRLANASVALLGPDYAFGSRPYLVCKSLINDMRAPELGGAWEAWGPFMVLVLGPGLERRSAEVQAWPRRTLAAPAWLPTPAALARPPPPPGTVTPPAAVHHCRHRRRCWRAGGALSTDDAVSAALETVLYSQMLVLFAPQAVPAKSHLPVLVR